MSGAMSGAIMGHGPWDQAGTDPRPTFLQQLCSMTCCFWVQVDCTMVRCMAKMVRIPRWFRENTEDLLIYQDCRNTDPLYTSASNMPICKETSIYIYTYNIMVLHIKYAYIHVGNHGVGCVSNSDSSVNKQLSTLRFFFPLASGMMDAPSSDDADRILGIGQWLRANPQCLSVLTPS